jgi:hypothetical protein
MADRFFKLLLLSFALLLFSCASRTIVTYDVNSFHDGSVAGSRTFNKFTAISYSPAFRTSVYEQNDDYVTDMNLKASAGANGYSISYGITNSTDIGGNFNWGVTGSLEFISFGGKIFVKQQIVKTASNFNLSILPCIGYTDGSSLIVGDIDIYSNLTGIELHIPMSFENKKYFTWVLNPKLFYFFYRVPINIEYETSELEWDGVTFRMVRVKHRTEKNLKKELFCHAISFGFSYKELFPELTIIHIDKSLRFFIGLGIKF